MTERLSRLRSEGNSRLPRRITLLKTAHHGSQNSTTEEFLVLARPQLALISAGQDNSYGHPHRETLDRLADCRCQIYQTPKSGAVTVRMRRGRVWVEEYVTE